MDVREVIRAAVQERSALATLDAPIRVFDAAGDGVARLVIERFGSAYRASGGEENAVLLPDIVEALGRPAELFHRFSHLHMGGPDAGQRVVVEHGLSFEVALVPHRNTGLFLEARPARQWVRQNSAGRRVLNLFAYTCAFGVAAAAGGARATTNVDAVPAVLEKGKRNYGLNGLPADGRTFWCADVFTALAKARRSGASFDGVILHAPPVPSGGVRGRRTDPLSLPALVEACKHVLARGGWLMVAWTPWGISEGDVDAATHMGAPMAVLGAGPDFVATEGHPSLRVHVYTSA